MRQYQNTDSFYNILSMDSSTSHVNSRSSRIHKRNLEHEEHDSARNRMIFKPSESKSGTSMRAEKKLPDVIVIGVSKCGTRAVLHYLLTHPGIAGNLESGGTPEVNFFSSNYEKGLEWYRNQMKPAKPGQITIEKSPSYFLESTAPQRIFKFSRSVKLMLVLCDPVYRLVSQYLQTVENHIKEGRKYPSIEEAVIDSETGEVKTGATILHGCFTEAMREWLHYFPLKQIHIVDGESLRENPLSEMTKIERYMGLEKYFSKNSFYFNETKGFYCAKINQETPKCMGSSKGRPHPKLRLSVEKKLRQFYSDCNKEFFEMIKQRQ